MLQGRDSTEHGEFRVLCPAGICRVKGQERRSCKRRMSEEAVKTGTGVKSFPNIDLEAPRGKLRRVDKGPK